MAGSAAHPNDVVSLLAGDFMLPASNGLSALHVPTLQMLSVAQAPQDGVDGAQPRDTRTKQQRAADDAAGKIYNPADGTYSTAPATTGGNAPSGGNTGGGFWDSVKLLFTDPAQAAANGVKSYLLGSVFLIVVLIIGILFTVGGVYIVVNSSD